MEAIMRNVVGQVVRGDDFWDRKDEIEDIWDAVNSGSHLLLVAPRRVGKTSIMYQIIVWHGFTLNRLKI